jgi:BlaI family penicillinase repressor
MDSSSAPNRLTGPRHSILDLAPLELECMNALWSLGEGSVREIHSQLAVSRPRAYTTILTIMDRLAQKGIVTRRKAGRAFRYQANLSAEEARFSAVEKIIVGFFSGSADALALHLSTQRQTSSPRAAKQDQRLSAVVAPGATIDAPGAGVGELRAPDRDENLP